VWKGLVLNKTLLAEDPRILSCKSVSSYEEGSKDRSTHEIREAASQTAGLASWIINSPVTTNERH
jgi:hypothetical protein